MAPGPAAAPLAAALGLFERAAGYARASLQLVTPELMAHPTCCRGWDLRALLLHLDQSLAVLQETVAGREPDDVGGSEPDDVVGSVRARVCSLLGTWISDDGAGRCLVDGRPLPGGILVTTAALELAVHGWDVAVACGRPCPLPPLLAGELLAPALLLVAEEDRPWLFAAPVPLPSSAAPSDRLVAFLGRRP